MEPTDFEAWCTTRAWAVPGMARKPKLADAIAMTNHRPGFIGSLEPATECRGDSISGIHRVHPAVPGQGPAPGTFGEIITPPSENRRGILRGSARAPGQGPREGARAGRHRPRSGARTPERIAISSGTAPGG